MNTEEVLKMVKATMGVSYNAFVPPSESWKVRIEFGNRRRIGAITLEAETETAYLTEGTHFTPNRDGHRFNRLADKLRSEGVIAVHYRPYFSRPDLI